MKILTIGFFAFICWSALSTYIYVCKINGLCGETMLVQNNIAPETTKKHKIQKVETMPENLHIYFDYNKSVFKFSNGAEKYFAASNAYLNQNNQATLKITGYTDETGTKDYNQELGYKRAQSLQHYFESKGIPSNKIKIESKGENEPAANNKTKEGRANNRRTVITIKK